MDARRVLSEYSGAGSPLQMRSTEWDDAPAPPQSGFRTMVQQLGEVARARNMQKREIAAVLRMNASTFSMQLRRGLSLEQIRAIAGVLNVHPGYFDEYVVQRFAQMGRENEQILRIARLRACVIDPAQAGDVDRDLVNRLWEAYPGGTRPTRSVPRSSSAPSGGASEPATPDRRDAAPG